MCVKRTSPDAEAVEMNAGETAGGSYSIDGTDESGGDNVTVFFLLIVSFRVLLL